MNRETIMRKTVIFESKFDVDIRDFSSTREVDTFLEKKLGRPLKVIHIDGIPIKQININKEIDKALGRLNNRWK